ncbi:heptaprenyl diphosphate synthase [Natranaerovirga pectinivora]|uniref:Heptaprenyl diphosphate synthase n=1 Tax=Natranaerovirga pectinivora TaxID=682400 RepID=A0A4R3MF64_9FIRM|nr:Gx transporter family protein [Natranaerovirga pectinivora]TCT12156.1 heptaprenyl diphosphate synthase [Natranaerovirga pectinivora]
MIYQTRFNGMSKVQKMVFMSMLISAALVLSYFERMLIGNIFPIQGAKLGLANIITLVSIVFLRFPEAFTVVILRIILGSFFIGTGISLFMSFAGGILSFLVMALLVKTMNKVFSIIIISVIGAITHSIGQIIVAGIIIENINIIYYLPLLVIISTITGVAIGIAVNLLITYMKKAFI